MNVFHAPETTMTTVEAEAVVRRHLERVPPTPEGPSIADVAEALKVAPEEIASLLAEIRAERVKVARRKVARRERRVWLLSGGLAIVIGLAGVGAMRAAHVGPFRRFVPSVSPMYGKPFLVILDGQEFSTVYLTSAEADAADRELPRKVRSALLDNAWRTRRIPSQSEQTVEDARAAVSAGEWGAAPGVRIATLEVRKGDFGNAMRWARATVPVYEGDDSLVADAVAKERDRRVAAAVKAAMKGLPTPPSR